MGILLDAAAIWAPRARPVAGVSALSYEVIIPHYRLVSPVVRIVKRQPIAMAAVDVDLMRRCSRSLADKRVSGRT
jgi:hypothetical protein